MSYYYSVTARKAKDWLIDRILIEADREGISLSAVERQMLEFSETENTPPNWQQLNAEFDRDYDQEAYEEKIACLIRHRIAGLRAVRGPELDQWHEAVAAITDGDHYIQVMLDRAEHPGSRIQGSTRRPPYDRLKLVATAAAIVIVLMVAMFSGAFDGCRQSEQMPPRRAATPASATKVPVVSVFARIQ